MSAVLDFEIINFREYDCSMDTRLPNCKIVEIFLTVDTSRKLQNGVNIDISIDRWVFGLFYSKRIIFRGMDILKNDVTAVLGEIFDTKLKGNNRHSTMTPALDKQINWGARSR